MAQSLSKLYVHIIFHVKSTFQQIRKDEQNELYSYIGYIIKQNDSIPIVINGVGVHDHTKRYIENQEKHHQIRTYREEVKLFLDEYGIDYDENYLWSD